MPTDLHHGLLAAILAFVLLVHASVGQAQSSLDGFNPGTDGYVSALVVQPDGKILVGGNFFLLGGSSRSHIGRLNPDGSLDTSFNPGADAQVYSLALQPDGKILVGGNFTGLGGGSGTTARNRIGRLNADGSVDSSFNPGANNGVLAIALQTDGKIVLGGFFTGLGGGTGATVRNQIGRLNADGSVDAGFNPGANSDVYALELQPDGKILAGGFFTMLGGGGTGTTVRNRIGRLNSDGSLDTAFNPGANSGIRDMAVQPDGRIVVGGDFSGLGGETGTTTRNFVGRLNRDGSVDATFDPGANARPLTVQLQSDGKILLGGFFTMLGGGGTGTTVRNRIGRLSVDGSLDASFNPGANAEVIALAVQPDGGILAGGLFSTFGGGGAGTASRSGLGRVYPGGSLDTNFDPGANNFIWAAAAQPDGKVVLGGFFTALDFNSETTRNYLGRLNPDGSLDAGFDPGANSSVFGLAVQPDGKIVVVGNFTALGGGGTGTTTRNYIGRLNANGSLDTAFNPGANSTIYSLALQSDGRILVGGAFSTIGGGGTGSTARSSIARLNADGTVDTTFDPGANANVDTIALQPDGKILAGGFFTTLGGAARNGIGRLNADGSIDAAFNPNAGTGGVAAMVVQPDGKIVVGGSFTTLAGATRNRVGRLNLDGTLDATFDPGANSIVHTLALQVDGKILLGGPFTALGGGTGTTTRNRIGRLNPSGSLDAAFDPGANNIVHVLLPLADGKILAAGIFTTLGGGGTGTISRTRIGRLVSGAAAIQNVSVGSGGQVAAWSRSGTGSEFSRVTFESSLDDSTYTSLGSGARVSGGWQLSGLNLPTNQNLFVRARGHYSGGWENASQSIVESVRNVFVSCGTIAPTSLPSGTAGSAYSATTFTAAGALGVVTFGVTGTLPAGMTFNSGVLSGTPTQTGTFPITVTATDSYSGCMTSQNLTLSIGCPTITVNPSSLPTATRNVAYSAVSITQSGGIGSATFSVTSGTLPPGMTLSSGGILSGTPNTQGAYSFTVTATDVNGCTGSRAYTVVVVQPTDLMATSSFDVPGAVATKAYGINNTGQIVGTYRDSTGRDHGFLRTGSTFSTIDYPGSTRTIALGINDGGDIVGCYYTFDVPGACYFGFLLSAGTYTPVALTGAFSTNPVGIAGSGEIVGTSAFPTAGFRKTGATFTPITVTGADQTYASGINSAGSVVGHWQTNTSGPFGYMLKNGTFTTLTFPGAGNTQAYGINGTEQIVGDFFVIASPNRAGGFLLAGNTFTTIEVSGLTSARGINDVRQIVGYHGFTGTEHAFVATLPCPAITVTPSSLPSSTAGTPYPATTFGQTGAIGATTFAVTSGTLAPGLTLSSSGVLSGTATAGGTFGITVTATDSTGCQGSRAYTVTTTCSYSLSPATREVVSGGGTDSSLSLSTGGSCTWTASSNVPWLRPVAGGTGSGTVTVTIDPNKTALARTGQVTVQGQTTTFTQVAATVTATTTGINPALSGNGRYLAFEVEDGALVPNDVNGVRDIFVRDRITDTVVRVSVSTSGAAANGPSFAPALSDSGRYAVFESDATNLVAGDTNGVRDVFLRDRDADGNGIFDEAGGVATVLVSQSSAGSPGRGASGAPSISADGDIVVFASEAANLVFFDTNGVRDIFVSEQPASPKPVVTRVNLGPGDAAATGASDHPVVSRDGRYVAFDSDAPNLVAGDTNGVTDVFVRDRTAGTTTRVSLATGDAQVTARSYAPAIARDGTLVVFTSDAALVAQDTNSAPDIYGRPPAGGATTRISVGSSDLQGTGSSTSASVSGDGRYVAFASTAANLSSLDTNGMEDIYVRDRTTGQVRLVLFANQVGNGRSFDPSLSADGLTVAFSTEATLPASMSGLSSADTAPGPQAAVDAPVPTPRLSPTHGPANTAIEVQITGPNLKAISSVSFGDVSVRPRFAGDALLVTAPARAPGKVDVTVVSGVVQGLKIAEFTYDAPEEPMAKCEFKLALDTGQNSTFPAAGGSATARVTVPAGCSWTPAATLVDDWISAAPASPAPVDGSGTLTVHAEPNTNPNSRSAGVLVAGLTLTFTQEGQGCTYVVDAPASGQRELPPGAGVDRGVHITAGPGCPWKASADDTWVRDVASGAGSAIVEFAVEANTTSFDRTTTLTVEGTAVVPVKRTDVTIMQFAQNVTTCTYTAPNPAQLARGEATTEILLSTAPAGTSCPWNARSESSWLTIVGPATGTTAARIGIKVSANDGGTRSGTVDIAGKKVTVVQEGRQAGVPFGVVDTPTQDKTGISGSIALTGWALDDKGVTRVDIWRAAVAGESSPIACRPLEPALRCQFIGSAVFVRGSRPDVQALYPSMPNSDRAGWGYLLLTNYLPNGGNGTFRLIFIAYDEDGALCPVGRTGVQVPCPSATELAVRTITVNNATATAPFGSIDTPDQGATVEGTAYANFGWALTPRSKTIPTTGATINVFVDSVRIGSPRYDLPRSDIASLFPGFNNSAGPVGLLEFDTSVLADGVHTIAWVVTDDAGASEGIGSRFFRVQNGTASMIAAPQSSGAAVAEDVTTLPLSTAPVRVGHGFDSQPVALVRPDRTGTHHLVVRALDVVRLDLGGGTGAVYEGHAMTVGGFAPLPAGSTFDAGAGTFAWQLGPGFVGVYDLLFVRTIGGVRERIPVRIVVEPFERAAAAPILVDPPAQETTVAFRVTGSVTSGTARQIHEVVIYAYPADGGAPVVVGRTAVAGAPPDAGAPFGGQFARTSFAIDVSDLLPGTYDLLVVGKSAIAPALDGTFWVRSIEIR